MIRLLAALVRPEGRPLAAAAPQRPIRLSFGRVHRLRHWLRRWFRIGLAVIVGVRYILK